MSNKNEAIYSQVDMDGVLAVLREAEKEAEHSRQLLWAVVESVGGEVSIPYIAWLEGSPTKHLEMRDDQATLSLHLKIVEVDHVQSW